MSMRVIAKLLLLLLALSAVLVIAKLIGGVTLVVLLVAVCGCFALLHWRAQVTRFHCMWWEILANARRHRCKR